MTKAMTSAYKFQLLRYAPNVVSGEYFNVGVLLYDEAGRVIDARFTPDFRRLRCHPLADIEYLESLRNEFEQKRLGDENFGEYWEEVQRNLGNALQISEQQAFWGAEPREEVERLLQTYVATPSRLEAPGEQAEPPAGSRRALRRRMDEVFRRYHLFANGDRLLTDVSVPYGGPRWQFVFDYAYRREGATQFLQGLALRNDVSETTKLCFVFERLRAKTESMTLTAVVDDEVPEDTSDLLRASRIVPWQASRLEDLALRIRSELHL
jgi:hypothetical protein